MFGRNKQKSSPSKQAGNSSGEIIQGFVCPICLSHFGTSNDLEVHFASVHDKPQIQDDELVLMRQQVSAAEQTRELMQGEIARQLESIKNLESTISSLTADRSNVEMKLQKALLELSTSQESLEEERKSRKEAAIGKESSDKKIQELTEEIGKFPSAAYIEQLESKCEAAEKIASLSQAEVERMASEHIVEVAKLQDSLTSVQSSFKDFMNSLSHLLENIDSFETISSNVSPECSSMLETISVRLKDRDEQKNQLESALRNHESMKEKFVEEKSKLHDHLENVEQMQARTRSKLLEVSRVIGAISPETSADVDNLSVMDSIGKTFSALRSKNEQLESEIERNVSDEDVIKRLRHEHEVALSEKTSEMSALHEQLDTTRKRIAEIEPASAKLTDRLIELESRSSALEKEKSGLQVTVEAREKLLQLAFHKFDASAPVSFDENECMQFFQSFVDDNNKLRADLTKLEALLAEKQEICTTLENDKIVLIKDSSAMNEMVEWFKVDLERLRGELAAKSSEAEAHLNSYTTTEATNKELETSLTAVQAKFDNLQTLNTENCQTLQSLRSERDRLKEENSAMAAEKEELKKSLDDGQTKLLAKESDLSRISGQLQSTESELELTNSAKKTMEGHIAELEHELSVTLPEKDRLSQEMTSIAKKLASVEGRAANFERQVEQLNESLRESNEQKQKVEADLKQVASEFESAQTSLSEQLVAANKRADELGIRVDKEKLVSSERIAEVRIAQEACAKLEAANTQLLSQVNKSGEDLALCHGHIDDLKNEIAQQKADRVAEVSRLKSETDQLLDGREAAVRSQFSMMETRLRSEMASLLARLESSQQESQDLEEENQDLRRRVKEMEIALQELGREQQNLQIQNTRIKEHRWKADAEATTCEKCQKAFSISLRRHHCRNCGLVFCHGCSSQTALVGVTKKPVRVCDACFVELT